MFNRFGHSTYLLGNCALAYSVGIYCIRSKILNGQKCLATTCSFSLCDDFDANSANLYYSRILQAKDRLIILSLPYTISFLRIIILNTLTKTKMQCWSPCLLVGGILSDPMQYRVYMSHLLTKKN